MSPVRSTPSVRSRERLRRNGYKMAQKSPVVGGRGIRTNGPPNAVLRSRFAALKAPIRPCQDAMLLPRCRRVASGASNVRPPSPWRRSQRTEGAATVASTAAGTAAPSSKTVARPGHAPFGLCPPLPPSRRPREILRRPFSFTAIIRSGIAYSATRPFPPWGSTWTLRVGR